MVKLVYRGHLYQHIASLAHSVSLAMLALQAVLFLVSDVGLVLVLSLVVSGLLGSLLVVFEDSIGHLIESLDGGCEQDGSKRPLYLT